MNEETTLSTDETRIDVEGSLHAPDSLTLRFASDIRMFLMTGRTFVMQVAHPSVGAGVGQLSRFREDPWRRLVEIDRSGRRFTFSGREASLEEGRRLRRIHRNIKGTRPDGTRFHSLDPDAYGWVHTVFLDTHFAMRDLYGEPLSRREEERLFIEWLDAGHIFGLSDADMPSSLDAYRAHYDRMIEETLEHNDVVDVILRAETPPKPARLSGLSDAVWRRAWAPVGSSLRFLTLGALPPAYRAKIAAHHPWTPEDEARMKRFRALVRGMVPRLPKRLRYTPIGLRAMRASGSGSVL